MSEVVDLCRRLVQFKTDENNIKDALVFFQGWLEKLGFVCEIITLTDTFGRKVDNLYARIGNKSPHLMFCGHMDVVPAGDLKAWKFPPFEGIVDDGILYGRGISDMKGGTACFAAAVKEYLNENKLAGSLSFLISGDEEEPIVDGTKGVLEILQKRGEKFDFALVGEPTNPQEIGEEIKIGRRGDVTLTIVSKGVAGHTAYPQLAVNPIHNLVYLLEAILSDKLDDGNDFFGPTTIQCATFDVANPAANVIPAQAKAVVDIRFNSNHTSRDIIDWAQRHIEKAKGDFELVAEVAGEAFLTEVTKPCEQLKAAAEKICGRISNYSTSGGTSDARFVKNFGPVVEFGLTNSSIHKINECAKLCDIELLKDVYKEFIRSYFAND